MAISASHFKQWISQQIPIRRLAFALAPTGFMQQMLGPDRDALRTEGA